VQHVESLRGGDAGGVEDQPAEGIGPATAEVVADQFVVVGQCRAQRLGHPALAADEERPGQRRLTRTVPPQDLRLGYAELLGQEGSGPGVDHLGEQVGSHVAAFRDELGMWGSTKGYGRTCTRVVVSITNLLQSKNRG